MTIYILKQGAERKPQFHNTIVRNILCCSYMCIRVIIASTEHEESWNMKYWYISFLLYTCLLETFSSNGIPPTSWAPWQWSVHWTVLILQWLTQLFLHTVLENQFMLSLDKKISHSSTHLSGFIMQHFLLAFLMQFQLLEGQGQARVRFESI